MFNSSIRVLGVAGRVCKAESNRESKSFKQFLRQYSSYSISSLESAWNVRNKIESFFHTMFMLYSNRLLFLFLNREDSYHPHLKVS